MRKMTWHQMVDNGRIRTRGIEFPRRERVLVRAALDILKFRYMEIVPIFCPLWHGKRGDKVEGDLVWYDFFYMMPNGHMACILFDLIYVPSHGSKPSERLAFQVKQDYMKQRGVPCLVLDRKSTVPEYAVQIQTFNRRNR